jgi:N-acetylglucosamine-6-phosphate deacetylase
MVTVFRNGKLISEGKITEGLDLWVEGTTISEITPRSNKSADRVIDLEGKYLAPGFIDLHCHGAAGYEFIDGTEEAFFKATALHAAHGTRVLYPTISATDYDTMYQALLTAEKVKDHCALEIPGVHLEGPYLSAEMCGGQDKTLITPPKPKEYMALIERFGSLIARWTYAPEHDDQSFLKALTDHGIVPSIGHSAATYDTVKAAFDGGCHLITHLYSCTSTITRQGGFRKLGIIESAYLLDEMDVEAIADGCHLPPELMRLIVKLKTPQHVCLITDAIRHAGMTDIEQCKGGTERIPYIIEDGVAKLADRSAFAGSIATTEQLLKRTVAAGIPLADTVLMMTEVPARVMGLTHKGKLLPGYDAQFTTFQVE